jgi:beta-lactamase superfamily II metal-dependent hydrolase
MPQLWATFIDVGWGDSILLELEDGSPNHRFALIDSNDTSNWPNAYGFLKRHLERYAATAGVGALPYPLFDFVVASHAHADHTSGLQRIIKLYGADRFYFPRFNHGASAPFARLVNWASTHIQNGSAVTNQRRYLSYPDTFVFGPAQCSVLWPPPPPAGAPNDPNDRNNENNNSLVLAIKLQDVVFVTTGDCEAENWRQQAGGGAWKIGLPAHHLKFVQVPHHGAQNGLFDSHGNNPMLDQIRDLHVAEASVSPMLGASCHPKPYGHPDAAVAGLLDTNRFGGRFTGSVPGINWLRTDKNLHFTVWTDRTSIRTISRPPH